MGFLINIALSAIVGIVSAIGVYTTTPLSFIEKFSIDSGQRLGSSITTIAGGDTISSSRTVINTNFSNLNNGKIENSTTSVAAITTLANLGTIGKIISGFWNAGELRSASSTITYASSTAISTTNLTISGMASTTDLTISGTCTGCGGLSGGTAGMLAAWTGATDVTATNSPTVGFITATSTKSSVLPYASSTAISTVNLNVSGTITGADWQECLDVIATSSVTSLDLNLAGPTASMIKFSFDLLYDNNDCEPQLQFNGDFGANYRYRISGGGEQYRSDTQDYGTSILALATTTLPANTRAHLEMDIYNGSTTQKTYRWILDSYNAATPFKEFHGWGGYIGTTSITNIQFNMVGANTFGAGTRFMAWCKKN